MKHMIRDIVPPILWRRASRFRTSRLQTGAHVREHAYGVEQLPEFYDQTFRTAEHWKKHYTESHYYPLWSVIGDRVRRAGAKKVVDVGCGPGQVACLLRDLGVPEYIGLDFSRTRVERARTICPEYEFILGDVFEYDVLEADVYDTVLMMEFLEHVEEDLRVVERVRGGTTVLATLPNFPSAGHVRYFDSVNDVRTRYGHLFSGVDVSALLANAEGKTFYIMEGRRVD